jgi:5-methylthioadenosine/S-adenosylhomocysteine deaminase
MAMLKAGITVGLGTDSVAAGRSLDLFAEMRLAAQGLPLTPRAVLRLVTADAAAALGLPDAGRLVRGAWGDLAALTLAGAATADAEGVEALVTGAATPADVTGAWVAGRESYAHGTWPGVDAAAERLRYETACERAREAGVAG